MSAIELNVPAISGRAGSTVLRPRTIVSRMEQGSGLDRSGNLGLEAEYFLLNGGNSQPQNLHVNGQEYFPALAGGVRDVSGEEIVPEMDPALVEVHLDRGYQIEEVLRRSLSSIQALYTAAAAQGLEVFPFGASPFRQEGSEEGQLLNFISEHPDRYYRFLLAERDGVNLESLSCAGMQFHYQETHGETAVGIYNALRQVVPIFAGLSASSPFYRGRFTGYLSERLQMKKRLPLSGLPPLIRSFEQYIAYLQQYLGRQGSANTIQGASPGYFLMRLPRLDLGTLEFCACDNNPDLQLMIAQMDLFARICRQTANYVQAGQQLPSDLFGDSQFAELDGIRISQNLEALQKGYQHLSGAPVALGNGENVDLNEYFRRLFDFLRGTECGVDRALGQPGEDATRQVIERTLISGSVANQILDLLQIDGSNRFGRIIDGMPDSELIAVYRSLAEQYSGQVNQILNNLNHNYEQCAETRYRAAGSTDAVGA